MALYPTTGQGNDIPAVQEYQKAKGLKKEIFDPRYQAIDALTFMFGGAGGLISNITKQEAINMLERKATKFAGELGRETWPGYKNVQGEFARMPEEAFTPVEKVQVKPIKGKKGSFVFPEKRANFNPESATPANAWHETAATGHPRLWLAPETKDPSLIWMEDYVRAARKVDPALEETIIKKASDKIAELKNPTMEHANKIWKESFQEVLKEHPAVNPEVHKYLTKTINGRFMKVGFNPIDLELPFTK